MENEFIISGLVATILLTFVAAAIFRKVFSQSYLIKLLEEQNALLKEVLKKKEE